MEAKKMHEIVTEEPLDIRLVCVEFKCMFPSWYLPGAVFLGDSRFYYDLVAQYMQEYNIGHYGAQAKAILRQRIDAMKTNAYTVDVTEKGFIIPEELQAYLDVDDSNNLRLLKIILQGQVFYYLIARQNLESAKWLMKSLWGSSANYEFQCIKSVNETEAKETTHKIEWKVGTK